MPYVFAEFKFINLLKRLAFGFVHLRHFINVFALSCFLIGTNSVVHLPTPSSEYLTFLVILDSW
jgi:hypothetical protein